MENDLTDAERAALYELVPADRRTGDLVTDLAAAARETMERRRTNTALGAAVLEALRRRGYSWRQIDALTGIPWSTARRWHTPPGSSSKVN